MVGYWAADPLEEHQILRGISSLSYFMEKTGLSEGDSIPLIDLLARHIGLNRES